MQKPYSWILLTFQIACHYFLYTASRSIVRYKSTPYIAACHPRSRQWPGFLLPEEQCELYPSSFSSFKEIFYKNKTCLTCPIDRFLSRCSVTISPNSAIEDCILDTVDISELLSALPYLIGNRGWLSAIQKALNAGLLFALKFDVIPYLDILMLQKLNPKFTVSSLLTLFHHDTVLREYLLDVFLQPHILPTFFEIHMIEKSMATASLAQSPSALWTSNWVLYYISVLSMDQFADLNSAIKAAILENSNLDTSFHQHFRRLQNLAPQNWQSEDALLAIQLCPPLFYHIFLRQKFYEICVNALELFFNCSSYQEMAEWFLENPIPFEIQPEELFQLQHVDLFIPYAIYYFSSNGPGSTSSSSSPPFNNDLDPRLQDPLMKQLNLRFGRFFRPQRHRFLSPDLAIQNFFEQYHQGMSKAEATLQQLNDSRLTVSIPIYIYLLLL
jgi:hypothetical protein